jgi:hypothetical protein
MSCVSDEYRTGQTRVALVAALQRWQQAIAVRQKTVGAIEQVHPVVVLAGERDRGGVGLELAGRQECLLGMLFALRHIVHRHRRVGVARRSAAARAPASRVRRAE